MDDQNFLLIFQRLIHFDIFILSIRTICRLALTVPAQYWLAFFCMAALAVLSNKFIWQTPVHASAQTSHHAMLQPITNSNDSFRHPFGIHPMVIRFCPPFGVLVNPLPHGTII
jgi:hypothetical protein